MSNKNAIIVLLLCLIFQVIFSFLFPVYDPNNQCQHSSSYFLNSNAERMKSVFSVGEKDFSWTKKFFSWFGNYHMVCDATSFLFLARNFPKSYEERNIYIDHPLYNFFAFLILKPLNLLTGSLPSYPVIFGVLIIVNFLMAAVSVILFYFLVSESLSLKIGFLSALFLVFSPFIHAMINQPTSSGIMEIFVVVVAIWLLWNYLKKPSLSRLVIYSLIFGILLLGKQIFALSFFVLILAFYFGRKKEGLIFAVLQFIPTAIWYLCVRFLMQLSYYMVNVKYYDQGSWFLKSEYWHWDRISAIVISAIPNFLITLVVGFLAVPIIFSIYGLFKLDKKYKYLIYFSFSGSFLLLFFGMNYYRQLLSFLVFPVIYPTAVFGILAFSEYLKKYGSIWPKIFYFSVLVFIFIISNINFYEMGIWEIGGITQFL